MDNNEVDLQLDDGLFDPPGGVAGVNVLDGIEDDPLLRGVAEEGGDEGVGVVGGVAEDEFNLDEIDFDLGMLFQELGVVGEGGAVDGLPQGGDEGVAGVAGDLRYHLNLARDPSGGEFLDASIYYEFSKNVDALDMRADHPQSFVGHTICGYSRIIYKKKKNLNDGLQYVKGLQIPRIYDYNNEKFRSTSRFTLVSEGSDYFTERRIYDIKSAPDVVIHYRVIPKSLAPDALLKRSSPPEAATTTINDLMVIVQNLQETSQHQSEAIQNQTEVIQRLQGAIEMLQETVLEMKRDLGF